MRKTCISGLNNIISFKILWHRLCSFFCLLFCLIDVFAHIQNLNGQSIVKDIETHRNIWKYSLEKLHYFYGKKNLFQFKDLRKHFIYFYNPKIQSVQEKVKEMFHRCPLIDCHLQTFFSCGDREI